MQVPVKYLILTETWLNEDNSNVLSIPGYRCVSRSRGNRIGGGVAILIKEDIVFHVLDLEMLPAHASYEGIFVNVPQRKGAWCNLPTPWSPASRLHSGAKFIIASFDNRKVLLSGDFNIDLLKIGEHELTQEFLNVMNLFSLSPTMNYPTRVTDNSATLIDNIFSNFIQEITDPTIIIHDLADHFPITLWFGDEIVINAKKQSTTIRPVNDSLLKAFATNLHNTNWTPVTLAIEEGQTTLAYETFMSLYKYQYNRTFTQIEKPILKVTPKKPWMSKGLLISCRKKDKLYLKYRKCPTEANKIKYRLYRNKFKMLRIKAEKMYYEKEFNKHAHDSKRTWKVIKTLINGQPAPSMLDALKIDGGIVTDPAEIAHSFNGFFQVLATPLHKKFQRGK